MSVYAGVCHDGKEMEREERSKRLREEKKQARRCSRCGCNWQLWCMCGTWESCRYRATKPGEKECAGLVRLCGRVSTRVWVYMCGYV